MEIYHSYIEDVFRIVISGDIIGVPLMRDFADALAKADHAKELYIDLTEAEGSCSIFLDLIMSFQRRHEKSCRVHLVNPPDILLESLEIIGVREFFSVLKGK